MAQIGIDEIEDFLDNTGFGPVRAWADDDSVVVRARITGHTARFRASLLNNVRDRPRDRRFDAIRALVRKHIAGHIPRRSPFH